DVPGEVAGDRCVDDGEPDRLEELHPAVPTLLPLRIPSPGSAQRRRAEEGVDHTPQCHQRTADEADDDEHRTEGLRSDLSDSSGLVGFSAALTESDRHS